MTDPKADLLSLVPEIERLRSLLESIDDNVVSDDAKDRSARVGDAVRLVTVIIDAIESERERELPAAERDADALAPIIARAFDALGSTEY